MSNHIGSNFDDFLAEQGILEETSAIALKRVIAWQLEEARKKEKMSKKDLAARMHTSRTLVDRALDASDPGLTISTLARAAQAMHHRVEIRIIPEESEQAFA
ncbi:helix-turn-helix domain-containing protein [Pseudomonas sp. Marseille-QA0892]